MCAAARPCNPFRSAGCRGAWSSMISWRRVLARCGLVTILVAGLTSIVAAQEPQPRVTIGFVDIEGDPRHEPIRAYERMILKTREHPFVGAKVAIDEAQALSRALKIDFA